MGLADNIRDRDRLEADLYLMRSNAFVFLESATLTLSARQFRKMSLTEGTFPMQASSDCAAPHCSTAGVKSDCAAVS